PRCRRMPGWWSSPTRSPTCATWSRLRPRAGRSTVAANTSTGPGPWSTASAAPMPGSRRSSTRPTRCARAGADATSGGLARAQEGPQVAVRRHQHVLLAAALEMRVHRRADLRQQLAAGGAVAGVVQAVAAALHAQHAAGTQRAGDVGDDPLDELGAALAFAHRVHGQVVDHRVEVAGALDPAEG